MRLRLSTVAVTLVIIFSGVLYATPTQAGIPVVDTGNILQTTISAAQETAQTLGQVTQIGKQLQQYQKQVLQYEMQQQQYDLQRDQYEVMLLNAEMPDSFVWDEAQSAIDGLIDSIDTLSHYQNSLGSIDAYLSQFRDVAYYQSSPCFSSDGCSEAEMSAMVQNQELSSESQKMANDAVLKGLAQQQVNLRSDAEKLAELQAAAQGARGRLEALQYANQFASQQINQLLQIRGLLMAQQNALATQMQAQTNGKAQEQASSVRLRKGTFQPSPVRKW